ncbi:nucleoside hydrolase [Dysgonomonas sp. Marseille-P4677]|uniref:nucleoside hydrolase n=1 Tax=Dysgonomonas sp. Marseille-P4677 TaxID=2364790 RepID=UPI001912BE31|nr:nucleoside hydrolase [Dysgonomonas sp. Marseille-P4677]MBK5722360.1 nucleoside hydrolase [Dysgonomonas sp. Marseille-P4677]
MKNLICIICVILFSVSCAGTNKEKVSTETATTTANTEEAVKEVKNVKMIYDTDLGIDDAMALAYALGSPNIDLVGVTLTFGNVSTETSGRNTLDILSLLNREDIPVYAGALHSYSDNATFLPAAAIKRIHGDNGIGNVQLPTSKKTVEKQSAVDFIIESANKYGKDLVIVAVGPVTNLQDALKKEPKLKDMVGNIVIMGGALTVPGNVSEVAEANIYADPVAANELFTSETPFTMVGLDVTVRARLTKEDTKKWRDLGTASGKAFADIVDYYIGISSSASCALHDPLAVAVAVHPELIETISMHMFVGTSKENLGRTTGDKTKLNDPNPNVKVGVNLDYQKFLADFNTVLTELFKKN